MIINHQNLEKVLPNTRLFDEYHMQAIVEDGITVWFKERNFSSYTVFDSVVVGVLQV